MHKFRLLTISMVAAGAIIATSMASAAVQKDAPTTKDIGNDIAAAGATIGNDITTMGSSVVGYLNKQMYQMDNNLSSVMTSVEQTLLATQNASASRQIILNSSEKFNKTVLAANSWTKGTPVNTVPASPSGSLASYNNAVDTGKLGVAPYSYMQLMNTDINISPETLSIDPTSKNTPMNMDLCRYGYAGTDNSKLDSMPPSYLAAMSATLPVKCQYSPQLTQAINYIHMLAGYGTPMLSGYSGMGSKIKGMDQASRSDYKTDVKSLITARSVGEDALFDLMQGRTVVGSAKSIVETNNERYASQADDPQWHMNVAHSSSATVARQQTYQLADIKKELGTLITLQRKQLALSATNEMLMSNLVYQGKLQGLTAKMKGNAAAANAKASAQPKKKH